MSIRLPLSCICNNHLHVQFPLLHRKWVETLFTSSADRSIDYSVKHPLRDGDRQKRTNQTAKTAFKIANNFNTNLITGDASVHLLRNLQTVVSFVAVAYITVPKT
jgi:hypothetical protein